MIAQAAPVGADAAAQQNASTASAATDAFGLGFDALLKIILTQLTYQDPLKPMDNFEFVSQLAQFSQIQQSQTMNDRLELLVSAQATSQATSLLGTQVDVPAGATTLTGTVTAVTFDKRHAADHDQDGGQSHHQQPRDRQHLASQEGELSHVRCHLYRPQWPERLFPAGLEQVSNNVTNLNTSGFRGSTVTFQNYYGGGSQGRALARHRQQRRRQRRGHRREPARPERRPAAADRARPRPGRSTAAASSS